MLLSFTIAVVLAVPVGSLEAQDAQLPATTALNIVVVAGEGEVNNVGSPAHEPVVRIEDQNRQPVKGAAVVFTLPTEGATGEFHNGAKTLTVVTGAEGTAKGTGLKVFRLNGKLPIHVTASYRGLTARALITETVEGAPAGVTKVHKGGSGKMIAILAIIGAGAAGGGIYAATANKKTSSSTPSAASNPIGITPGTGTIAPPR
jgi:hypothetical protein